MEEGAVPGGTCAAIFGNARGYEHIVVNILTHINTYQQCNFTRMRTSYDCTSHVQDLGGHVNELQQESNNHKNISICNVVPRVCGPPPTMDRTLERKTNLRAASKYLMVLKPA